MSENPYVNLPKDAFWKEVSDGAIRHWRHVYTPKFVIRPRHRLVTLGSCFAQHLSREFVARGYNWFDGEPGLKVTRPAFAKTYGYGLFSYRTGNIYTPRLLRQWLSWAAGETAPPELSWEAADRVLDPFRPRIEPDGFRDTEEMLAARAYTIERMTKTLPKVDIFVFTLGLTETWEDTDHDIVYPMCPGTVGGTFDPETHVISHDRFGLLLETMEDVLRLLKGFNDKMKVLLTVSPVPMIATVSGQHIVAANGRSKSVLRALAAELHETRDNVDYFPSYELITAPPVRSRFFADNMRDIDPRGVKFVMDRFFAAQAHARAEQRRAKEPVTVGVDQATDDEVMAHSGARRIDAAEALEPAAGDPSASNRPRENTSLEPLDQEDFAFEDNEFADPQSTDSGPDGEHRSKNGSPERSSDDVVCEEVMLEGFAKS